MLQHLHEGRIDALRQLIYDCGRISLRRTGDPFIASVAQQCVRASSCRDDAARNTDGIIIKLQSLFALKATEKRLATMPFASGMESLGSL